MIVMKGKVTTLSPGFDVRRILPQAKKRTVGSFCFLDHFGPVSLTENDAMDVGPHPHIGLATLSYLYDGAIIHRDSTGAEQIIIPYGVNYMSSGKGVTHSERGKIKDIQSYYEDAVDTSSSSSTTTTDRRTIPTSSHGLQLWLALPATNEDVDPSFHHGEAISMDNTMSSDDK